MFGGKGLFIVSLVGTLISAGAAVVTCIDNVKNGDRRAQLQGAASGKAYAYAQEEIKEYKKQQKNKKELQPLM